jgi:hypothetical protein
MTPAATSPPSPTRCNETTRAYDVFGTPLQTVVSKDHNVSLPVTITTPAPM